MKLLAGDPLPMWTIYKHPSDFPDSYVVRRSLVTREGAFPDRTVWATAPTLEGCHAFLPPGLVRLPRKPDDDPVIVEVWF